MRRHLINVFFVAQSLLLVAFLVWNTGRALLSWEYDLEAEMRLFLSFMLPSLVFLLIVPKADTLPYRTYVPVLAANVFYFNSLIQAYPALLWMHWFLALAMTIYCWVERSQLSGMRYGLLDDHVLLGIPFRPRRTMAIATTLSLVLTAGVFGRIFVLKHDRITAMKESGWVGKWDGIYLDIHYYENQGKLVEVIGYESSDYDKYYKSLAFHLPYAGSVVSQIPPNWPLFKFPEHQHTIMQSHDRLTVLLPHRRMEAFIEELLEKGYSLRNTKAFQDTSVF